MRENLFEGNTLLCQKRPDGYDKFREKVNNICIETNASTLDNVYPANLLYNISRLSADFPKEPKNILSLGCGEPIDYFALRAFYGEHVKFNYVGIDIDNKLKGKYNISNLNLIICDGSDKEAIRQNLKCNHLWAENGFDIIFMRHPDINNKNSGIVFKKMLQEVIPFAASKECLVYISCYAQEELDSCLEIMQGESIGYSYKHLLENQCQTLPIYGAPSWIVDHFTFTAKCHGFALDNKNNIKIANDTSTFFNAGCNTAPVINGTATRLGLAQW